MPVVSGKKILDCMQLFYKNYSLKDEMYEFYSEDTFKEYGASIDVRLKVAAAKGLGFTVWYRHRGQYSGWYPVKK